MNTAELLKTADQVHSAAIRANEWSAWRNFGRMQCQSAFMRAAVAAGVAEKTPEMRFVVTKCLSLSGYGS
mgnify:FL=1